MFRLGFTATMLCVLGTGGSPTFAEPETGSVRDFATRLAERGVPAGVVAAEDDLVRRNGPPPEVAGGRATAEGIAATLSGFNASNPAYHASQHRGVVHLRRRDEPVAVRDLLKRPLLIDGGETSPLDAVFKRIMSALIGGEPGGIAGVGVMPGVACPLEQRIRLVSGSVDLGDALDEIVRQAPGLVWLVSYEQSSPYETLKIGLVCPDGSTLKMTLFD